VDIYMIVLRIVHIFSGVFWVGGGVLLFAFVEPAARATAPAGQKFMQQLMVRQRFNTFMAIVSLLTVLAGALLYLRDSAGLNMQWILTGSGLVFTFGALMGITVFFVGLFGIKPAADRLGALGGQIEAAGTPPTKDQVAELTFLNARMALYSRIDFVLLTLALLAMATARYF
jgi:hypothetical protein